MKIRLSLLFSAVLLVGCGAASPAKSARVASEDRCWSDGTLCTRSSDCCSLWCVNSYCERREP